MPLAALFTLARDRLCEILDLDSAKVPGGETDADAEEAQLTGALKEGEGSEDDDDDDELISNKIQKRAPWHFKIQIRILSLKARSIFFFFLANFSSSLLARDVAVRILERMVTKPTHILAQMEEGQVGDAVMNAILQELRGDIRSLLDRTERAHSEPLMLLDSTIQRSARIVKRWKNRFPCWACWNPRSLDVYREVDSGTRALQQFALDSRWEGLDWTGLSPAINHGN